VAVFVGSLFAVSGFFAATIFLAGSGVFLASASFVAGCGAAGLVAIFAGFAVGLAAFAVSAPDFAAGLPGLVAALEELVAGVAGEVSACAITIGATSSDSAKLPPSIPRQVPEIIGKSPTVGATLQRSRGRIGSEALPIIPRPRKRIYTFLYGCAQFFYTKDSNHLPLM
jgi:hypothetical protein